VNAAGASNDSHFSSPFVDGRNGGICPP
jgi:hypothetical protein